jgi:hypothetical protein
VAHGPDPYEPAWLRWLIATGPRATPLHRYDAVLFWQTRLSRLGPRSRPLILLIAGASLGQTQPLDFCNEFSITTHEHITRERCPHPPQGDALPMLPCTMRFSRCPHHPLFDAKMAWARYTAASYANSPTPGLEIRTPKARELSPSRAAPFKWAREAWETRRSEERSEGEPPSLAGRTDPSKLALRGPSSIAPPDPSCH